jgi:hypothetical protein
MGKGVEHPELSSKCLTWRSIGRDERLSSKNWDLLRNPNKHAGRGGTRKAFVEGKRTTRRWTILDFPRGTNKALVSSVVFGGTPGSPNSQAPRQGHCSRRSVRPVQHSCCNKTLLSSPRLLRDIRWRHPVVLAAEVHPTKSYQDRTLLDSYRAAMVRQLEALRFFRTHAGRLQQTLLSSQGRAGNGGRPEDSQSIHALQSQMLFEFPTRSL